MLSSITTIVLIIFVNSLLGYGSAYFLQLRPRVMTRNTNLHASLGRILNIPSAKELSFDAYKLRREFLNKTETYIRNRKPFIYKVYKPYQPMETLKNNSTQRVNDSIRKYSFTNENPANATSGLSGFEEAYKVSLSTIMLPLEVVETTAVPSKYSIHPTTSRSIPTTKNTFSQKSGLDGFDKGNKASLTKIELPLEFVETTFVPSSFLINLTTSPSRPTAETYEDDLPIRTTTQNSFIETTESELYQTSPLAADSTEHSPSKIQSSTTESFVTTVPRDSAILFQTSEEAEADTVLNEVLNVDTTNLENSYYTPVSEITTDSSTDLSTISTSELFDSLPTTTESGSSMTIPFSERKNNIEDAEIIEFQYLNSLDATKSRRITTSILRLGNKSIEYTSPVPEITTTEFEDLISFPSDKAATSIPDAKVSEDSYLTEANAEIFKARTAETASSSSNRESAYPIDITSEILPYIETKGTTDRMPKELNAHSIGIIFPGTTPKIFVIMDGNSSIKPSTISAYTQTSIKPDVVGLPTSEAPKVTTTNSEIEESTTKNTQTEEITETNLRRIFAEVTTASHTFDIITDTFTTSSPFNHLSLSEAEDYAQATFAEGVTESSTSKASTSTESVIINSNRLLEETTLAESLERNKNYYEEATISAFQSTDVTTESTITSAENSAFHESNKNADNNFRPKTPLQSYVIFELPESTEATLSHSVFDLSIAIKSTQEKTTTEMNYENEISYTTLSQITGDQDTSDFNNNKSNVPPEPTTSLPTEMKEIIAIGDHKFDTKTIENDYLATATHTEASTIDEFTDIAAPVIVQLSSEDTERSLIVPETLTTTPIEHLEPTEKSSYSRIESILHSNMEFLRETSTSFPLEEFTTNEKVPKSHIVLESLETTEMPDMDLYSTFLELDAEITTTKTSNEIITEFYVELATESWMSTMTTEDILKHETSTSLKDIRSDSYDFSELDTEKPAEYQNDDIYTSKSISKKTQTPTASHKSKNRSPNYVASIEQQLQELNTSRNSSLAQVKKDDSALKFSEWKNQSSTNIEHFLEDSSSADETVPISVLKIGSSRQLLKPNNLDAYQKQKQIKYSTDVMPSLDDLF